MMALPDAALWRNAKAPGQPRPHRRIRLAASWRSWPGIVWRLLWLAGLLTQSLQAADLAQPGDTRRETPDAADLRRSPFAVASASQLPTTTGQKRAPGLALIGTLTRTDKALALLRDADGAVRQVVVGSLVGSRSARVERIGHGFLKLSGLGSEPSESALMLRLAGSITEPEPAAPPETAADSNDLPISMILQEVPVADALRSLADFTGVNLVMAGATADRTSLRLMRAPWRQALELLLRAHGLDHRWVEADPPLPGARPTLLVAPTAELANQEQQRLEHRRRMSELLPRSTAYFPLGYAKAAELWAAFVAGQDAGASGSALIDARTNSILFTGTAAEIEHFRTIVSALDVPVRQVLIESRIITLNTDLSKQFGVRWGGSAIQRDGDGGWRTGGSLDTLAELQNGLADPSGVAAISTPGNLVVDLGVSAKGTSSIGVGYTGQSALIDLEISALVADGQAEIMARPKVITADQSRARIETGVEIPYQEASSSGATATAFKDAVLSLAVTPSITPKDRILLAIQVKQDNVGRVFNGIPSINTNEIDTRVLIGDGETVVLGGIFQTDRNRTTEKTPLLGDLPLAGRLFRRTFDRDDRQELLIFITPRILPDPATGMAAPATVPPPAPK